MKNKIRTVKILYSSCVDGVGFRDVLFVGYCPHRCAGCHNPETWSRESGEERGIDEVYNDLTKSAITNVTFSGGEPFEQAQALTELARRLKNAGKSIWIYSGYLFEDIIGNSARKELLELCEVLVDGPYIEAQKGINMRFRGSENQRILDVQSSLKKGKPVEVQAQKDQ